MRDNLDKFGFLGHLTRSFNTVEPLYYGHQGDKNKCRYYRGVRCREVCFIWILVTQGPSEQGEVPL